MLCRECAPCTLWLLPLRCLLWLFSQPCWDYNAVTYEEIMKKRLTTLSANVYQEMHLLITLPESLFPHVACECCLVEHSLLQHFLLSYPSCLTKSILTDFGRHKTTRIYPGILEMKCIILRAILYSIVSSIDYSPVFSSTENMLATVLLLCELSICRHIVLLTTFHCEYDCTFLCVCSEQSYFVSEVFTFWNSYRI